MNYSIKIKWKYALWLIIGIHVLNAAIVVSIKNGSVSLDNGYQMIAVLFIVFYFIFMTGRVAKNTA